MEQSLRIELCMKIIEFVKLYADVWSMKQKVTDGECMGPKDLKKLDRLLEKLSISLLEVKYLEMLAGMESVDIPLDNANFNGFSIKDGELVGDTENAYLIAEPWFKTFITGEGTTEADCFKFFIATFIVYMNDRQFPDVYEEMCRRNMAASIKPA